MTKLTAIYRGVKDTEGFHNYFQTDVLPTFLEIREVKQVQLNNLFQLSLDSSEDVGSFQFICSVMFETHMNVEEFVEENELIKTFKKLPGEASLFFDKDDKFHSTLPIKSSEVFVESAIKSKILTIFGDVSDAGSFLNTFTREILPGAFKIQGLTQINVKNLSPADSFTQETSNIQFINEVYIESNDVLNYLIYHPEGAALQEMTITKLKAKEISVFLGKEQSFFSTK